MTPEHVEDRLASLRAGWPARSIVDRVMARLAMVPETEAPPSSRSWFSRWPRLITAAVASGLLAAFGLAWLVIASQPTTLLAAIAQNLARAGSAHLDITVWDDKGQAHKSEIWYRQDGGLRAEGPDDVLVEDNQFQWTWRTGAQEAQPIILRQPRPNFLGRSLARILALPEIPSFLSRDRAPDLDRQVSGIGCRGYMLTPTGPDPDLPPGARPVNQRPFRGLVLADAEDRVHEITFQDRRDDGTWRSVREMRIDYGVAVPPEKIAVRLPAGARVIDRDRVFEERYPLDRALHRVEAGGLLFAVHDVRPMKGREGFYVVSSVRPTAEFLRKYPPRRRWINAEVSALDVAMQPMASGNYGGKYDRIVLGNAAREGVEFSWWMIIPRRYFQMKDGKKVFEPENDISYMPGEPGRLDDLAGKARVPLSANYWDERLRDPQGAMGTISQWVEVALPADREPTTLEDAAARARHDLLIMRHGGTYGLLGVAADSKVDASTMRSMSYFEPEKVTDAEYAAAVRRGFDDLRQTDEVHEVDPGLMAPAPGRTPPPR
jgi:hypothetical protein